MNLTTLEKSLNEHQKRIEDILDKNYYIEQGYIDDRFKDRYEEFLLAPSLDYVNMQGALTWYNFDQALYEIQREAKIEDIYISLAYSSTFSFSLPRSVQRPIQHP